VETFSTVQVNSGGTLHCSLKWTVESSPGPEEKNAGEADKTCFS